MSKNSIYRFKVLFVKKQYSLFFGDGLLFYGYSVATGRLMVFYVPFHKIIAVEDISKIDCCCIKTNKFGFISRVSVPVELVEDVLNRKNKKNILGGIL